MSTEDNDNCTDISNTCANCGKEGSDVNNTCNKCKQVKYCNASCKKKHRHKHKKECEEHVRLAAERAAELHDELLFKEPPSLHEDCPICFQRMPTLHTGWRHKLCCGKKICSGCIRAVKMRDKRVGLCPFCRIPTPTSDEETLKRAIKLVDAGDAEVMCNLGLYYSNGQGRYGLPQDYTKALALYHRAAELGYVGAYCNIGTAYHFGNGVEVDIKKAKHYYELAAMKGHVEARFNLGADEENKGNFARDSKHIDRAIKHYMIAVKSGDSDSLKRIQLLFTNGHVAKEEYTAVLRLYQEYLGEIKSAQRDEAAAANKGYRYY